jgi:hypothetical protein
MTGQTWVEKALRTADPSQAERYLLEAIRIEPDLGTAYGLRARLAVLRHDAVAAAHHFRVAYARGDRTAETRVGLSFCLAVAGQNELAARVREDAPVPPSLVDFEDVCETVARPIRAILAAPLPPRGEPALLPGERAPAPILDPDASTSDPRATAEQVMSIRPPSLQTQPQGSAVRVVRTAPPPEAPPEVAETPAGPPVPATPAPNGAVPPAPPPPLPPPTDPSPPVTAGGVRPIVARRRLPEWIDQIEREPLPEVIVSGADWITTNVEAVVASPPSGELDPGIALDADEALEVTHDPGTPQMAFRSPVTGRMVRPDEIARQRGDARMPAFEPVPDLLGRAPIFADLIDIRRLIVALELPGPVLTVPGAPPRPLCRIMAFGATKDELFFRDIEKPGLSPVRLPRATILRMDVVNDDQQISFALQDGRQLHLDLRALARTHSPTVRHLVRRLAEWVPHDL